MKKFNFVKLASIALAITMLMGSFVFTAIATDETTGEVAAYNVYYGDRYQLMFAVNAPDGATITVEDSEGNELKYVSFEEDPTPTIDGVVCDAYIVSEGVAVQAIDEIITVTIEYAGEELDSRSYSVLEYVYERIYVDKVEGAELAMYEALLAYADAADIAINGATEEESLGNYKYVNVTNGTLDGSANSGIFLEGDTFENATIEGGCPEGQKIVWSVQQLNAAGVVVSTLEGVEEIVVGEYNMIITGELVDENMKVVTELATFALGDNGTASHTDGSETTSYTETVNNYTLSITGGSKMYTGARDAKGNSCIKFGTSGAAGSCTITVPENVTEVVIYVAMYKAKTSKITVNGTTYTLTNSSDDGLYDVITIDTTSTKTITFTTVSGGYRCMVNTIVFNGYAE